jgi:hypothetical protein
VNNIFYFGEIVKGYDVPVLNEREARAAAGIIFLLALLSFLNAFILRDFFALKVFITAFFIDFFIRVIINPNYSPTLILGRIFIQNQKPEYVGAPQKRFAWAIGLVLSFIMFWIIVIFNILHPINLIVCLLCLVLLFFEAAFGICIGCKMYNWFCNKTARHCPGGVCEFKVKDKIQKISWIQSLILVIFCLALYVISLILI